VPHLFYKELEILRALIRGEQGLQETLQNPVLISAIGTIIFAIIGARALSKQIKRVKREGAKDVSVEWTITSLAMFGSLLTYAVEIRRFALLIQFFCRVPYYLRLMPLIHKRLGRFTWWQYLMLIAIIPISPLYVYAPKETATALLWVSVIAAFFQPAKMWWNKGTMGVERDVIATSLGSAITWTFYGLTISDYYIVSWAVGYTVAYTLGVIAYQIYYKGEVNESH